jgi:hypothetical protein
VRDRVALAEISRNVATLQELQKTRSPKPSFYLCLNPQEPYWTIFVLTNLAEHLIRFVPVAAPVVRGENQGVAELEKLI